MTDINHSNSSLPIQRDWLSRKLGSLDYEMLLLYLAPFFWIYFMKIKIRESHLKKEQDKFQKYLKNLGGQCLILEFFYILSFYLFLYLIGSIYLNEVDEGVFFYYYN
jgi:hypothetical protein